MRAMGVYKELKKQGIQEGDLVLVKYAMFTQSAYSPQQQTLDWRWRGARLERFD